MDGVSDTDIESDVWQAHTAAAQGDTAHVVQAVQQDPSVLEQEDSEGLTPLIHAVKNHHMGTMKKLIKLGANINAQDGHGRTSLATAVYQGWYEGVVYLLRKGAKQNIPEKSGRLPIHASTYDKDIRIIGALLQTLSKEDVCQTDNEKMTALHWAAFHNRPEHFQLLIMSGISLTSQDIDGKTALHWAAQNGSVECCNIIIQCSKGPDLINLLDNTGKAAIHYAAAAGHSLVLKMLAGVDGCHLEAEDPDDRTPLHWAAAMGQPDCVRLLLEREVTANPVDIEGGSPLDYAQQSGHSSCIKLLEDKLGIKHVPSTKTKTQKSKKSSSSDGRKSASSNASQNRKSSYESTPSRSPFGKLKDLFKSKSKRHSNTPTATETSDSIEMSVISDKSTKTSKDLTKTKDSMLGKPSAPKDIPTTVNHMVVPKIVLSSIDNEEDGVLLKQRRKHKKSRKSSAASSVTEEVITSANGLGRHNKQIGVLSPSPSNFLPPVMSPRISPIPPKLSAITLENELNRPPPRKSKEELAPLRVPAGADKNALVPDSVARLQRERNGINRSPTPPPPSWHDSAKKTPGQSPLTETEYFRFNSSRRNSKNTSHISSSLQFTDDGHDNRPAMIPRSGRSPSSRRQSQDTNSEDYGDFLTVQPRSSRSSSISSRRQSQDTSPWLHVGDGQGELLAVGTRSRNSRRQSHDRLSTSSGQRSGLSSAHSAHSNESNFKLSPIPPMYGTSPLLTTGSPPQLSTLEKRTLDRTIQSLLH